MPIQCHADSTHHQLIQCKSGCSAKSVQKQCQAQVFTVLHDGDLADD
jgi:hypothetical protein